MAEGDNKSMVFRTSAEFLRRFRELDGLIDAACARGETYKRKREPKNAGDAAVEHSELCQQMQDLILDEIERHWGPLLLDDDPTRPEFPDDWRLQFFGRLLRISYRERAAYKGD